MVVDCREYESVKVRLIKGDKKRALGFCEELNKIALARDGVLRQGKNRSNISDAIHVALDCLEKHGLQSAVHGQLTLSEVA